MACSWLQTTGTSLTYTCAFRCLALLPPAPSARNMGSKKGRFVALSSILVLHPMQTCGPHALPERPDPPQQRNLLHLGHSIARHVLLLSAQQQPCCTVKQTDSYLHSKHTGLLLTGTSPRTRTHSHATRRQQGLQPAFDRPGGTRHYMIAGQQSPPTCTDPNFVQGSQAPSAHVFYHGYLPYGLQHSMPCFKQSLRHGSSPSPRPRRAA